ncbi:hypothetical protein VTO73DRAFT_11528 [Trametes versicolor]
MVGFFWEDIRGSLSSEDSRLSFALRSFPHNFLILIFSSCTFLLPRSINLSTMVVAFILTRTFAISALLVGALPVAFAAPVPSSDVVRAFVSLHFFRKTDDNEISIATQSFDKRFCRQMSCLFEAPTDTTATEAADADSEPTKIASSDGTEAVFVAGGIDTSMADTPEEGDVEDTPEPTDSV